MTQCKVSTPLPLDKGGIPPYLYIGLQACSQDFLGIVSFLLNIEIPALATSEIGGGGGLGECMKIL